MWHYSTVNFVKNLASTVRRRLDPTKVLMLAGRAVVTAGIWVGRLRSTLCVVMIESPQPRLFRAVTRKW